MTRTALASTYTHWKAAEIAHERAIVGTESRRKLARAADRALDDLIAAAKALGWSPRVGIGAIAWTEARLSETDHQEESAA